MLYSLSQTVAMQESIKGVKNGAEIVHLRASQGRCVIRGKAIQ